MTSFHSPPLVDWEDTDVEIIVPIFTVVKSSVERQCTHGRDTVVECHRETSFLVLVTTESEVIASALCPKHVAYLAEEELSE